jgi:peptidoglycan/LPS O-acetylase OafA/YrhL
MAAPARTGLAARAAQSTDASTARHSQLREIPALDGLRCLAVLLVIWCHVRGFTFTPATDWLLQFKSAAGLIGLYLFFILSGFLLFLPYAAIFATPATDISVNARWPSVLRFYRRRAQRILPVFYAALLAALLFATLRSSSGLFPAVPGPRARSLLSSPCSTTTSPTPGSTFSIRTLLSGPSPSNGSSTLSCRSSHSASVPSTAASAPVVSSLGSSPS